MRVQCVICDEIHNIPDFSPEAKKLRNRPIHTYMCDECYERVTEKTLQRLATGHFEFRRGNHSVEEEF
ncbi:YlaI family protein [Kurthia huakuii]|uniref:YlaI family protein n=1 Tax=Kurthia huakuii TaxID=1421019 RepID=UPI000498211A|nr:YlaI family protein [Kurthia huakuii]MBM7698436.1 uncharacterized protein YlaI [Kurthia huakuii]